jgi:putative DNA primase/helicase
MTSQVVASLHQKGFVLHPLKGKVPITTGWQKLTETPPDIETHIEKGGNVGAVCGKASDIIVIDLDSMLFADEIFSGKIETLCAERTEGRRHVYFKYNPRLPASKHHDLTIEILSDGNNIVLPPSKHPSGDLYHWKNPDAPILDMPPGVEANFLRLFKTETELKQILSKCRHCFRDIIKRKPDMHGADGREMMVAVCADMKANGANEAHIKMFAKLMYQEKFDEGRTLQEWRNIDPAKTWTCDKLRAKVPAYVDLADCEKCEGRRKKFEDIQTTPPPEPQVTDMMDYTDDGNAKRLVALFGDKIRYCHPWKSWLCWNGKYWERDKSGQIFRYAKDTVRVMFTEAEDMRKDMRERHLQHAIKNKSVTKLKAMVFLAESEQGMTILPDDFDKNKMLFNVQNGTVELDYITGQGKLREHKKEDYITRISPAIYDAGATRGLWRVFIDDITKGEPRLIEYLQKMAGQLLSGEVREKAMYVLHGKKDTGKTTFVETLVCVLENYAETMAIESLMKKSRGGIPNDIAALKGKRFVFVDEPDFGDKLSEGVIKKLTGLDTINARFLNEEFFKFKPEYNLWILCNNFPDLTDKDPAVWGRVKKIPFLMKLKEIDTTLQEKLKSELSDVLNWMIEGCLSWQKEGMKPPEIVLKATEDIKEDFDSLADFFNICCIIGKEYKITHQYLYTAFQLWAMSVKRYPMSKKAFTQVCENREFERTDDIYINKKKFRGFVGITLTDWMVTSVLGFLTEPDNEKKILRTVRTDVQVNVGRPYVLSHVCGELMCSMRSNCVCLTNMCILSSVPSVPSVLLVNNIINGNNQTIIEQIITALKEEYDYINKPDSILDLGRMQNTMEGFILNKFDNDNSIDFDKVNIKRYIEDYCKARGWQ